MKKFIFTLALIVSALMSASAQVATENGKVFDNISIGVTGGVSSPLDFNSMFPVNANMGLRIQKDFTPAFGVQAEGIAILNDNHFSDVKTFIKATNVGVNGVVNLSNAVFGYKGSPRFIEVSLVGGFGWLYTWTTSVNNLTAKSGVDVSLNFGKNKAHSIVFTPAVYWNLNKFGNVKFDKRGSQLALNISYVYHFKTTNGTRHFKTYDVGAMTNEINALRGKLMECENREPKVIEKVVEKVIIQNNNNEAAPKTNAVSTVKKNEVEEWTVNFKFGKCHLSKEAMETLDKVGNDAIVNVVGEASPEGPTSFNRNLSRKRANTVARYLKHRGVNVKDIKTKINAEKVAVVTAAQ